MRVYEPKDFNPALRKMRASLRFLIGLCKPNKATSQEIIDAARACMLDMELAPCELGEKLSEVTRQELRRTAEKALASLGPDGLGIFCGARLVENYSESPFYMNRELIAQLSLLPSSSPTLPDRGVGNER